MRSKNINRDGSGNGADSDFINRMLERFVELQFFDSQTISVEQTTRGIRFHFKGFQSGRGGWDWAYPDHKELDTKLFYPKGKFVYISALNILVTAGMTDVITNANVISCEGYWQANRDIPAAAGGKYNVPVFPYPSGLGASAPSGTPLAGDLDSLDGSNQPAIYWIYWGQVAC